MTVADRSLMHKARWLVGLAIVALLLAALVPYTVLGTHEDGTHSGRAIAVQADAAVGDLAAADVTLCDTDELDESGTPPEDCEVVDADIDEGPLSLTASLISGETSGAGGSSDSTSTITELDLTVGETIEPLTDPLLAVSATLIESTATASCESGEVVLDGDTTITGLNIDVLGQNVNVDVDAGGTQEFTVATATITVVIDDQDTNTESQEGGEFGDITVTALRIIVTESTTDAAVELVFAQALADILCPEDVVAPTAAPTDVAPTAAPTDVAPPATPTLPDSSASPTPGGLHDAHGSAFVLLLIGSVIGAWLLLRPVRRRDNRQA